MPALPEHRSGPGPDAARPGEVADFSRLRAMKRAIRRRHSFLIDFSATIGPKTYVKFACYPI
jgi:hypothetical protein